MDNLNKDYYTILGVGPDATLEEIKEAYHSRAKILHPDRFDPKTQPNEFKKANDMMADLIEAFEFLKKNRRQNKFEVKKDSTDSKNQSEAQPSASAEQKQDSKPQYPDPQTPLNQQSDGKRWIIQFTVLMVVIALIVLSKNSSGLTPVLKILHMHNLADLVAHIYAGIGVLWASLYISCAAYVKIKQNQFHREGWRRAYEWIKICLLALFAICFFAPLSMALWPVLLYYQFFNGKKSKKEK
ncbi:MAG: J domain-containing protein [Candidatus Wallbacteria bacterium]|nr:J domain-containing protein [Candidatus Wallbacteria bacterium]